MNDSIEARAATGLALLEQLERLLNAQNERNWLRGVRAAIAELRQPDSSANAAGFENARSIYLSMTSGGRGFSEYFIWDSDEDTRLSANSKLDQIRKSLWLLFNPDR
ncbi:hypothetical protein EUC41_30005 [Achromobacter denitrificans]|uniref:Uncharacterized protein n=1 Tax=Achromobacter denitrificans TaxID=32002 RepID=A0ABZ3GAS7_ACHDE|nr:hypothetical protein [Achromobacter denitrificans]QCS65094.1 hypothetical protein EC609_23060 [Achromobacter denitrificans]WFC70173.1 hypothetical protein EUC41_30005 [Achromobacter denitrificans]